MIPICLHKEIKQNKVFCTPDGNLLLTRDSQNNLRSLSRTCPHMGFDLAYGNQDTLPLVSGKLKTKIEDKLCLHCPYHGWNFEYNYAEQDNILAYQGVVFFDDVVDPDWVRWVSELSPQHWRRFKINCHWKHLLCNLVDFQHFSFTHQNSGGKGLGISKITYHKNNYIQVVWQTNYNRPMSSEVWLFKDDYTVVSRVPFGDSYLTNVSMVVPKPNSQTELLTNFFFDSYFYNTSPVMRWWANRIVDLLALEDKWVLEHLRLGSEKPQLLGETNPLILEIYGT
jgi:phenylpropionate dioxygenase-like ring-hydroxylating dioxygenase large terminal subunit